MTPQSQWPVHQPSKKGFFVFFGPPGSGKSTEAGLCFQRSLYVQNAPNNLQFYSEWLQTPAGQQSGLGPPARIVTLDSFTMQDTADPSGSTAMQWVQNGYGQQVLAPYPQAITLTQVLQSALVEVFTDRAHGHPPRYSNIVIDEGGTFLNRVFEEIIPTCANKKGERDTRTAYNVAAEWASNWTNMLRAFLTAGLNVCLVAHDTEPDPGSGKKGGPKLLSKPIMGQICADADGVLLRTLVDQTPGKPAARVWRAHASQHWHSKLRGLSDEQFADIVHQSAHTILQMAGYAPF